MSVLRNKLFTFFGRKAAGKEGDVGDLSAANSPLLISFRVGHSKATVSVNWLLIEVDVLRRPWTS